MLGLPFVAVMPASTSPEKIELIEFHGGRCHFVEHAPDIYEEARRLAAECGGHYLDQFTYAERATDWRGNNNIAESIFEPARARAAPAARVGRRRRRHRRHQRDDRPVPALPAAAHAAGRRRPGGVVVLPRLAGRRPGDDDRPVLPHRGHRPAAGGALVRADDRRPDDLRARTPPRWRRCGSWSGRRGRRAGGSTGTNLWGAFQLVAEMVAAGRSGSVVTLLCDGGERYAHTYYSDEWVAGQGLDLAPARRHAAAVRDDGGVARADGDRRHRPPRPGSPLPASNIHDRSQAGPCPRPEPSEVDLAMNIVVLVKQVPDSGSERKLDPADNTVARASADNVINEMDEYAIEEALTVRDAQGGEVTVLTVGPDSATDAIRKALSMGADKAVHVVDDGHPRLGRAADRRRSSPRRWVSWSTT